MKNVLSVLAPFVVIFGLLGSNEFLGNVATGYLWLLSTVGTFVLVLAGLISDSDLRNKLKKSYKERPSWRKVWSPASDLIIVLILAGEGRWLIFGVFACHSFISYSAETYAERKESSPKDAP